MKKTKITKKDVLSALKSKGKTKIVFRKQDGSIREMTASLKTRDIKAAEKKRNKNLITAVDADIKEWRSFNIEDVISIKKDVRDSFGVRLGVYVVKFAKRSTADKTRFHRNALENLVVNHSI